MKDGYLERMGVLDGRSAMRTLLPRSRWLTVITSVSEAEKAAYKHGYAEAEKAAYKHGYADALHAFADVLDKEVRDLGENPVVRAIRAAAKLARAKATSIMSQIEAK